MKDVNVKPSRYYFPTAQQHRKNAFNYNYLDSPEKLLFSIFVSVEP